MMYNLTSYSQRLFGTDGIRGKPGLYPLTDGMLFKIGCGLAHLIQCKDRRKRHHRVIIGKDTRLSGQRLELILSDALNSYGIEVLLCGTLPTPGLSRLVQKLGVDMGVMISASHNKASDNGIKLITQGGMKISLEDEESLEHMIVSSLIQKPNGSLRHDKARTVLYEGAASSYLDYLCGCCGNLELSGYKIMVDCSFGAAAGLASELFQRLGANVRSIHDFPNGHNINVGGVSDISYLQKEMHQDKPDIGFALDGDGDRLMLVSEDGAILDGDYIMAIIAIWLLKQKKLKGRTLVTTIASNQGLIEAVEAAGGRVIRTEVGEKFVVQSLLKNKLNFGGEQAGQVIYLDYASGADALLAALMILAIMKDTAQPLSVLAQQMKKIPQVLVNVAVKEKKPFHTMTSVWEAIMQSQKKLSDQGRLVVRYSGTEDLARIMVEGRDKTLIEDVAYALADVFKSEIGEDKAYA